ncbi:MAG: hypothetical protein HQK61_12080 [Desulfamplus sp.]|nr:hypothetical protein [Desulfamplus sp.]
MKSKLFIIMCMALFLTVATHSAFAAGSAKLAVSKLTIQSGEELGAVVVLGGTGKYDVYAAIAGGILGNSIYLFTGPFQMVDASQGGLPKLMDNADIGSLSAEKRIITLMPKFAVPDGTSLAGDYTFFVALTTPGKFDFNIVEAVTVTIKK